VLSALMEHSHLMVRTNAQLAIVHAPNAVAPRLIAMSAQPLSI